MHIFLIIVIIGTVLLAAVYIPQLGLQPAEGIIGPQELDALSYYSEQLPPYNYLENGTVKGVAVDILEEITTKIGKKVTSGQIHIGSWTEAYQSALTLKNTVLFSTVRLPEREQSFKWVGPVYSEKFVLFANWDQGIVINSPADLKEYRIGVIVDDSAILQLLNVGVDESQLVYGTDVPVIIEMLAQGDIDLWCYPESSGRFITEQVTRNYYSFKVVYSLENVDFYYAFSKDVSNSIVKAFQQSLDVLKHKNSIDETSMYGSILGKYIPSIGLKQLNYLTEEWAPFNYQQGTEAAGISIEILNAILKNVGVDSSNIDISFVPLSIGFQQAQINNSTVLFSIARTSEREPLYKWVGPFTKSNFVLYAPVEKNITITSPEDLNSYRIGVVKSTVENELLISKNVNTENIVATLTSQELIQMIEEEQIDLWATGDLTGHYEMNRAELDTTRYEVVYTLGENEFYFIFSKDVPDILVDAFDHALEIVKNQKDSQGVSEYERIIYRNLEVCYARQQFTDEQVIALVDYTASGIEQNAIDTLRQINAKEAPYLDSNNVGLYVFVYDINTTMVAHADNILLVGANYKGKTDVTGKPFRDYIIAGALENKTGWVEYVYVNPAQTNLYYKTTYYRLASGSDNNLYIVCCGNFKAR